MKRRLIFILRIFLRAYIVAKIPLIMLTVSTKLELLKNTIFSFLKEIPWYFILVEILLLLIYIGLVISLGKYKTKNLIEEYLLEKRFKTYPYIGMMIIGMYLFKFFGDDINDLTIFLSTLVSCVWVMSYRIKIFFKKMYNLI